MFLENLGPKGFIRVELSGECMVRQELENCSVCRIHNDGGGKEEHERALVVRLFLFLDGRRPALQLTV